MNAKTLFYKYDDCSGAAPVRVYQEPDFKKAEEDLDMMREHASSCKEWFLIDTPVYGLDYEKPYNKQLQEEMLEALKEAKAVMESAGITEDSIIGGEQYAKVVRAIKKATNY